MELTTRRVWERSKGDTMCPTTSQNSSRCHPSWLSNVCTIRTDLESEWLATENLETNLIKKPKTASYVEEQFSWVPLAYCSPPGQPLSIKSLALSTCVSPQTIQFWVLDKSPLLGPGRVPLPAQQNHGNIFSHSFEVWKPEIRLLAMLSPESFKQ